MAHKLFIGGLPFSTSSERLREVFTQAGGGQTAAGGVEEGTGRARGLGFVEMATAEEAGGAGKKDNGQGKEGRTLEGEIPKSPGARGGWGRAGGRRPANV